MIAANRWGLLLVTQCTPYSWDRGSTWGMVPLGGVPLRVVGPQLPLPLLLRHRLHPGRGKLRRDGAVLPLPPLTAFSRGCYAIVSDPSIRTRAQKFCQEEQADLITELWISPQRTNFICNRVWSSSLGCRLWWKAVWKRLTDSLEIQVTRRLASLLERQDERDSWEQPSCGQNKS